MKWQEVLSCDYMSVYRSYDSLQVVQGNDSVIYAHRGIPVLRATHLRGYPKFWIPTISKAQRDKPPTDKPIPVVHKLRSNTMTAPTDVHTPKSKKDQATEILTLLKQNSTLNRGTAIMKFKTEIGVSSAYAATLWQNLKNTV